MRKFVLVDHSLQDLGGHHYAYACEIVAAVGRAGLRPIVATHRDFSHRLEGVEASDQHALFHHASYSPLTFDMQASRPGLNRAGSGWSFAAAWRARARARLARAFAADCRTLFGRVALAPGDQVFIATASELDLTGLGHYLRSDPAAAQAAWHVQFHFGIFRGRDPDYPAQSAAAQTLRAIFRSVQDGLDGVQLRFYCTTGILTDQYQQLGVAPFATLPYPVYVRMRTAPLPIPAPGDGLPARIACLGHARREKRLNDLPALVRRLWSGTLRDGHAQLVLQTHRRSARRELARLVASLGERSATAPIQFAPFPLDLAAYSSLLCSAALGLMLYDSERYYARCSGVLLELLCAGVPVIVPAGCWLAEQIVEPNQVHLEGLLAQATALPVPLAPALHCTATPVTIDFDVPAEATQLLLRLPWQGSARSGRYLRLRLRGLDAAPSPALAVQIAGPRVGGEPTLVSLPIAATRGRLQLELGNAWHEEPTAIGPIEGFVGTGERAPVGAVGVAISDLEGACAAIEEILRHAAHYRRGAAAFARPVRDYYNADRLVAQLLAAPHA